MGSARQAFWSLSARVSERTNSTKGENLVRLTQHDKKIEITNTRFFLT